MKDVAVVDHSRTGTPDLLLIGDGRLARHLSCYLEQLGLRHAQWSRRMHAEGQCPELNALVHSRTHALLAISDGAIEPFTSAHPELGSAICVHFSGRLSSPLAIAAHPLFSFTGTLYDRELYERIPFVIERGAPPLASLIPGLKNLSFFIEPERRSRYHALCVLAGDFTKPLLWQVLFERECQLGIALEHVLPYLEAVTPRRARTGPPPCRP